MKTIPVNDLDSRLTQEIEKQDLHEAIGLTTSAGTVAWVFRVPESFQRSDADVVFFGEGPSGRVTVIVQAKDQPRPAGSPAFGAGSGTLDVISEDEEHLKDFQEYMK